MVKTVFVPDFWKDNLWLFIIPVLLGLIFFLAGIAFLFYVFISGNWIMIIPSMVLIFSGQALMYTLECSLMQRVIITSDYIVFRYPKFYWPFSFNEEKVSVKDIISVSFGYFLMSKLFPDFLKSEQSDFSALRYVSLEIKYRKGEDIKTLGPPIIHDEDYYTAVKGLIKSAKLKPTSLGFVFKKIKRE